MRKVLLFAAVAGAVLSGPAAAWVFTAEQEAKLLAADGTPGDDFGSSVALDGDTAVIGAWGRGAAYVFVRSGEVWVQQAQLVASDEPYGNRFGKSVAIDGDTVVVGAYHDNIVGIASGSAYVFTRSDGIWTEQVKLLPWDGGDSWDNFGNSVAVDGDRALIGAYQDDANASNSGSAYVFQRVNDVWFPQTKLLAPDAVNAQLLGCAVAIDGSTAVVGSYRTNDNGQDSGAAYVFVETGPVWSYQAKLLPNDGWTEDEFGISVAVDGETAVVGAIRDDDNGSTSGSAYVFTRNGDVWTQQAKLLASDGSSNDFFGSSVALEGNTAVVGASWSDGEDDNSGSAYVFTRNLSTWTEQVKLVATDGAAGDGFGSSAALCADTALVGASQDDDNGDDSGSAYVFALHGCRITVTREATATYVWYTPESSPFDVISGVLSDLLPGGSFSDAACLGTFATSPAVDTLPFPAVGDTRYYLARGLTTCQDEGYGNSSVIPDPRDDLDSGPCP